MAARVSGDREKGGSDRNQHGQGNNNEEWIEVNRNKNKNHNIQHGRFNGASGNNPSSRVSGNPNHKLLEKISTSVYITNLHWKATTKEIWDECAKWGTVVDIFISAKLSSVGARFGFVRFIRVRDVVNLITNLRTVWMGTFHIFADIARNQRGHKQSTSGKTQPQPEKGANGLGKSFAEALKHGTQGSGKTNQIYRQKTTSVHTKVNVAETSKKRSLELTSEDVMDLSSIKSSILAKVNEVQIPMEFYDPSSSSTASLISCSDLQCSLASRFSHSHCSQNNHCSYMIQYGDDIKTSGSYVSDLMHLNTFGVASNSSAHVVFGTYETGLLTDSNGAVNGIFGFGQHGLSIIAQLSSQGVTPDAFAHCLVGSDTGGGILVIGQIMEPNMIYIPLVPSQPHYNVKLQSISVHSQTLTIDSSTFEISGNYGGTIIDLGTTLAYLPEETFHHFVDAITQSVSQSVWPQISKESWCYLINASVSKIFPIISFNFDGGAIMILRPQDYLLQQYSMGAAELWCIGFQISQNQGMTILGDLVLKDKLVIYDLGCQRIGWTNYDCSSSINVSSTSSCGRSEGVNGGRTSSGNSLWVTRYKLILLLILVVFMLSV